MTLARLLAKHATQVKRTLANSSRAVVRAGRKISAVAKGPCRFCGGRIKAK